jgi:hypothetical protein
MYDTGGTPWYACGSKGTFRSGSCVDREPVATQLREAQQRIKRLEDAGDAVAAIIGPPGSAHWADENQVDAAWNNWTKAKEAK